LPEVHCEANSSISILLAGLLLKLGIFGIMRFILSSFFLPLRFLCSLVLSLLFISIILILCSSYRYFDLKKMIAFSSILHLNLSFASIVCMNGIGVLCSLLTSIAHRTKDPMPNIVEMINRILITTNHIFIGGVYIIAG